MTSNIIPRLSIALGIDCPAMCSISRQLFGDQRKGRIDRGRGRQYGGGGDRGGNGAAGNRK
jgi:hypothetical protein